METKLIRVAEGKNSTLGHLYIGGLFGCYILEDAVRDRKIPSAAAYKQVYPLLVEQIERGNDRVVVYNKCSTSGPPSLR